MTILTNQLTKDVMGLTKTDRALLARQLIETLDFDVMDSLRLFSFKEIEKRSQKMVPPSREILEQPLVQSPLESKITLYNVTWAQYDTLVTSFIDRSPSLRMTYLKGTLQIMTTSAEHERLKKIIARLIEAYAEEKDIELNGYGGATFRKQAKERGLEPDECYCLGELKEVPDLAIEIVITSSDIDKLEVYRGLEVPEVWFFKNHQFLIYHLQDNAYQLATHSHFLREMDIAQLVSYVNWVNQTQAVKAYRATIRCSV